MKSWLDLHLTRSIVNLVGLACRHARLVVALDFLVTAALLVFVVPRIGFNMDHKKLLDPNLAFQRAATEFARFFPTMDDSLLVVIDASTADAARDAAAKLAERLRENRERFRDVYAPGSEEFFLRHALLYRTPEEIDDFVDHLARIQPILGELERAPSIANLSRLIRTGLEHEHAEGHSGTDWAAVLNRISEATVHVYEEHPLAISWENLMLQGSALDDQTRQVLVVDPMLEFDRLLVADRAIQEIRAAATDLGLTAERGVRVRITGNPALNYEEMLGLVWDVGYSSIFSFVLVVGLVFMAFRSWRLVVAAAVTLIVGLVWTLGFAGIAFGKLNVLSITFGVMFIGMGIDFAIHMGMQYVQAVLRGTHGSAALQSAADETGSSLVICAVTTMVGFFAFGAAPYRGVAELGIISGAGLAIILLQTLTLLPALATLLVGKEAEGRFLSPRRLRLVPPSVVASHPGSLAALAVVLGIASLAVLPRLYFDSNVIRMRNPNAESVQAFKDLLSSSSSSPWYVDAVLPTLAEADRLATRVRQLGSVEHAWTLSDFVPPDQDEKLEILSDAALMFDVPEPPTRSSDAMPVGEQVAALRDLHTEMNADWLHSADAPLAGAARRLRDELGRFLGRVEREGNAARPLADLQQILLGNLPQQIERLHEVLHPSAVTLATLPSELRTRMLAPDGHARLQIFPRGKLEDTASLSGFVDDVRSVAPDATGVAVNVVEFGRATVASLTQALGFAVLGIALSIGLLFGRLDEAVLVLFPVALAALLLCATMVVLDLPLNFANVVVVPLLLGAGVDSGIHLVHRARAGAEKLLDSTTARAVFYSAATTIASFASLIPSGHRGVYTLGMLLVFGMVYTLVCNLIVLPALLELRRRRGARRS